MFVAYWTGHYFVFGSAFALTLGLILLIPLVLIAMAQIEEIAAIAFPGNILAACWRRGRRKSRLKAVTTTGADAFPKVSIHIPAYFEPVDMLKQTLDAGIPAGLSEFPNAS